MGLQERIKFMNERTIEKISDLSSYTSLIVSQTKCTEVDDYGVHVGDQRNNPLTCATCGGDGFTATETAIDMQVAWVRGDEKIVTEAGLLSKGDVFGKIKTGYTLGTDDKIKIGSDYFQRVHKTIDSLVTFETWYLKKVIP